MDIYLRGMIALGLTFAAMLAAVIASFALGWRSR